MFKFARKCSFPTKDQGSEEAFVGKRVHLLNASFLIFKAFMIASFKYGASSAFGSDPGCALTPLVWARGRIIEREAIKAQIREKKIGKTAQGCFWSDFIRIYSSIKSRSNGS